MSLSDTSEDPLEVFLILYLFMLRFMKDWS